MAGEYDLSRKAELEALLGTLASDRPATIDLRGCTYADSTVLSILALLRVRFAEVPITLLGPTPQLRRLLKIVNFDKIFRIIESE
jgi:anti-anti-sigma factor